MESLQQVRQEVGATGAYMQQTNEQVESLQQVR